MDRNKAIQTLGAQPDNLDAIAVLVPEALKEKNWNVAINLLGRAVRIRPTADDLKLLAYVCSELKLPRTTSVYLIAAKSCQAGSPTVKKAAEIEWQTLQQKLLGLSPEVHRLYGQLDLSTSFTDSFRARLLAIATPDDRLPLYEAALQEGASVKLMSYYASDLIAMGKLNQAMNVATAALMAEDLSLGNLANMVAALIKQRTSEELAPLAQATVNLHPQESGAWINLGGAFDVLKRPWESIRACKQAIALNERNAYAYNNLGNSLKNVSEVAQASAAYRRALDILGWKDPVILSNYLLALQYADGYTKEEKAAEHLKYGTLFPEQKRPCRKRSSAKSGPLKVGFVSADFNRHSCSYFLLPLWRHLKERDVFLTAYDNATLEDTMTGQMGALADDWCRVAEMRDEALLDQIRQDEIDILIDPAGHTSRNRLGVFGKRAAPVQLTWLGHPNTTGLPQMDFRVTDSICDPPGVESLYSEALYRMPMDVFGVYQPLVNRPEKLDSADYAVRQPPVMRNGYITFGSCNNMGKINDAVIRAWCRILDAVPRSNLLLEAPGLYQREFRQAFSKRFEIHGIDPARLQLRERDYTKQYLIYNDIDICLDPFPCNGGTTSFDLLWMGVPLVTLRGDIFVSRMGTMLLTHLQREAWIADDLDQYVAIAISLAQSAASLSEARIDQRQVMAQSALMNAELFGDQFADLLWSLAESGEAPSAVQK